MTTKIAQKDKVDPVHQLLLAVKALSRQFNGLKAGIDKISTRLDRIEGAADESDYLISVKDAAKILHVSPYTLRQDIRSGNMPAKHEGRAYLLSYNEVQRRANNKFK